MTGRLTIGDTHRHQWAPTLVFGRVRTRCAICGQPKEGDGDD